MRHTKRCHKAGFSLEKKRLNEALIAVFSYLIKKMVPDLSGKTLTCGKIQWTQTARLESSDQIEGKLLIFREVK